MARPCESNRVAVNGGALGVLVGGALLWLWRRPASLAEVTTTETYDVMSAIGLSSYSESVIDFARAVATAEGFYVPTSLPRRANNPGNLVIPGWTGPTLGAERISVFPTVEEGWNRLYRQLNLIVTGKSRVYWLDMTITEMGAKWAPAGPMNVPNAWATNVARMLEVPTNTPLRKVLT